MYRKIATAIVAVGTIAAVGGCAAKPATAVPAVSRPAAKPPCLPGPVVIQFDAETDCDLIGGRNELHLIGGTAADCADAGGIFTATPANCWDVDY
jgi:hypothetical protein